MIKQNSILKPHYQLLGMLLERHELKSILQEMRVSSPKKVTRDEQAINAIAAQLAVLDRDIHEHYDYVMQSFKNRGRTIHDLESFVGSDLTEELDAALQRFA